MVAIITEAISKLKDRVSHLSNTLVGKVNNIKSTLHML